MGFFDSIGSVLGSIGNIFGGSAPSVSTQSTMSGAQSQAYNQLLQYLMPSATQPSTIPWFGLGQYTAPMNATQTGATTNLQGLIGSPLASSQSNTLMNLMQGTQNPDILANYQNVFKNLIQQPLTETYQNVTKPGIDSAYSSKGLFYSGGGPGTGSRADATETAAKNLEESLASGGASLGASALQDMLKGQEAGISGTTSAMSTEGDLLSKIFGQGTLGQTTSQDALTKALQGYMYQNVPGAQPQDQLLEQILNMTTQQPVVQQGSTGALSQMLGMGGGIGIGQLLSLMMA